MREWRNKWPSDSVGELSELSEWASGWIGGSMSEGGGSE